MSAANSDSAVIVLVFAGINSAFLIFLSPISAPNMARALAVRFSIWEDEADPAYRSNIQKDGYDIRHPRSELRVRPCQLAGGLVGKLAGVRILPRRLIGDQTRHCRLVAAELFWRVGTLSSGGRDPRFLLP